MTDEIITQPYAIDGVVYAIARKDQREAYVMFDTPAQANGFVEYMRRFIEKPEVASRDAGGAAPSADSDGGANKQDRQLVNQGRDEGMRAAFLAMQEAQTGGGEAVAPEARADVLKQLRTAMDVVSALCDGSMRWTMSVPARPDSDPDLVISGALHAAEKLIATAPPAPPAPPAPLPGKRERALFQAWARDRHWNLSLRADGERYMSESTQEGWYAWKGRAALSSPPTLEAAPADYPPLPKISPVDSIPYESIRMIPGYCDAFVYEYAREYGAACVDADRAQRSGVSADPLPEKLDSQVHDHTDTHIYATIEAACWGEYSVEASRESERDDWYMVVTAPNGIKDYDGTWRRSYNKGLDEVIQQAIEGAMLRAVPSPNLSAMVASPQHQAKKGEPS